MNGITGIAVTLAALLMLAGCATQPVSLTGVIAEETEAVTVTHVLSGDTTEYTVTGGDLEDLRLWVSGLLLIHTTFAEGESPGDEDGGEAYLFDAGENSGSFAYIINGKDRCYLAADGKWYLVLNAVGPPAA